MCVGPHPYIPVADTAKVELFFLADSQQIENVFHVRNPVPWDNAGLLYLCTQFQNWVNSYYRLAMHEDCAFTGMKATDLGTSSGAVVEVPVFPVIVGNIALSEMLPTNVSLAIKWNTSLRGRSYRGRTFVPGLAETSVLHSEATGALVTILMTACQQLETVISANNWDHVVVSYCNNKAWRTTGVATKITSHSIDPTLDSQRRRLPGRGK